MRWRRVVFWVHLIAGVAVGVVIGVMSLTGSMLAFEPQVLAWADARTMAVTAPAGATARPVEELVASAQATAPAERVSAVTVSRSPTDAVQVSLGRELGRHVDPYTSEAREPGGASWRAVFGFIENVHRALGATGPARDVGKAVTGASALCFVVLGLTGLLLWWPRRWSRRAVRAVAWFKRGLKGQARDFQWHHVVGLWCVPVLLMLSVSGVVMSYRWASDLVYRVAGEAPQQGGPAGGPAPDVTPPSPDAKPLALTDQFERVQRVAPPWAAITLRMEAPKGGKGGKPGGKTPGVTASTFLVRESDAPTRFATRLVHLDPYTGAVLKNEGYQDATPGRKARLWLRFLHTGQALGPAGQAMVMVAALGASVLVWTGLALSGRRFLRWRRERAA